jgi:spermidine synthase
MMFNREKILFEGNTELGHYKVVEMVYEGRKARVLFSGDKSAAFSGVPLDGEHELLFDYIQRLFELVNFIRPKKLLMIGGGAYTLPTALLYALPDIHIDAVELDAGLDRIAKDYFGLVSNKRLRIFHQDGKEFLGKSNDKYDMIIIDAFSHLHIPKSLSTPDTSKYIFNRLTPDGLLAMNIISAYHGRRADTLLDFYSNYNKTFKAVSIYPAETALSLWIPQNFILVADKKTAGRHHGMRFGSLTPPNHGNK